MVARTLTSTKKDTNKYKHKQTIHHSRVTLPYSKSIHHTQTHGNTSHAKLAIGRKEQKKIPKKEKDREWERED